MNSGFSDDLELTAGAVGKLSEQANASILVKREDKRNPCAALVLQKGRAPLPEDSDQASSAVSMKLASWVSSRAPTRVASRSPSSNSASVGMPRTPYFCAT